jgi:hypothetical protein
MKRKEEKETKFKRDAGRQDMFWTEDLVGRAHSIVVGVSLCCGASWALVACGRFGDSGRNRDVLAPSALGAPSESPPHPASHPGFNPKSLHWYRSKLPRSTSSGIIVIACHSFCKQSFLSLDRP